MNIGLLHTYDWGNNDSENYEICIIIICSYHTTDCSKITFLFQNNNNYAVRTMKFGGLYITIICELSIMKIIGI